MRKHREYGKFFEHCEEQMTYHRFPKTVATVIASLSRSMNQVRANLGKYYGSRRAITQKAEEFLNSDFDYMLVVGDNVDIQRLSRRSQGLTYDGALGYVLSHFFNDDKLAQVFLPEVQQDKWYEEQDKKRAELKKAKANKRRQKVGKKAARNEEVTS